MLFAWVINTVWADARDLFSRAEEGFRSNYDARNALYAKIGRLRSSMEEQILPALSARVLVLRIVIGMSQVRNWSNSGNEPLLLTAGVDLGGESIKGGA